MRSVTFKVPKAFINAPFPTNIPITPTHQICLNQTYAAAVVTKMERFLCELMLSENICTKLYLKYSYTSDLVKVPKLLYLTLFNDTKSLATLITSKPSIKSLCVCRKDKALNHDGVMLYRSLVLIHLATENDLSGVALVAGFMGSS